MAKLAGKETITLSEMSQEINLKRYIGENVSNEQKRLFAELAVEYINERTLDNKKVGGKKKFARYSKEYADAKGVTRDSVDLFLKGDMLDSLDYEDTGRNKVKLLLDGDKQIKKGYNHQIGDTLPERQWFGLTRDETRMIADQVKDATQQEEKKITLSDLEKALAAIGIEQERG